MKNLNLAYAFVISTILLITASQCVAQDFKVGDKVEVLYSGKWYSGTVTQKKAGNTYRVNIGVDAAKFKDFKASDLRAPSQVVEKEVKTGGETSLKVDDKTAGTKTEVSAGGGAAFKVGDKVEGMQKNRNWYPVDILKVEADRYFVHWQGFDKKNDTWIEADKVRAVVSTKTTATKESGKTASSGAEDFPFKVGDTVDVFDRAWPTWVGATVLEIIPDKLAWRKNHTYRVNEIVSGTEFYASSNPIQIRAYTGPVLFNYTGKDFKLWQYVEVGALVAQIEDIKDGKFKITYNGREEWYAFDAEEVRNDIRTAAVAAAKVQHEAFFNECGKYAQSVAALCRLYKPGMELYQQGLPVARRDEIPAIIKDLDQLDAIIKSKYPNIQDVKQKLTIDQDELSKHPGTWREICEHRKELALKLVEKEVKDEIDAISGEINNDLEEIRVINDAGGVYLFVSSLTWDIVERSGKTTRPKFEARVKILADISKAAGYAADAQIKQFWELYDGTKSKAIAKISQMAPAAGSLAKYKDAVVEEYGKRVVMNVHPGSVVLRTGVISSEYRIETNALGAPRYRTKSAEISWRLPSGRCVYTTYLYTQDYNGGTYGDPYIWGGSLGAGYIKCQ